MKKLFLSITLCLACISICTSAAPGEARGKTAVARPEKTFNAESFTLKNGMQVVVIPNHRTPVVTHMLWYRIGAADEPFGSSGMAHYFEHLMFKGTKNMAPGEFSKTVKKLGGRDNAFTGQDYTAFFQSVSVKHLEKVMKMEADRMVNLAPPPEHFSSEKKVVIEERRQRTENDPKGLFIEQLQNALFVNHPYGTPIIGWMSEMSSYKWEDVKKFYDAFYAPNNAILIVSGDITAERLKPLAEKIYGKIPPKKITRPKRNKIPPAKGQVLITMHHELIKEPSLVMLFLAPAFSKSKKDSLALQVLSEILDGNATTRFYKSLVVDNKKAVSVNMSYSSDALDYGTIWISATPAEGISLEEMQSLILAEIQKVIDNGVTEKELKDAIQRLKDASIYARDSIAGPAMIFGHAMTTGSTIDDIEYWPYEISKVTTTQVKEVAKKYLNPENPWIRPHVTGFMMPETTDKEQEDTKQEDAENAQK